MACYIIGNWKMNGSLSALAELTAMAAHPAAPGVQVGVCPPATLIAPAAAQSTGLLIGAQDCHWAASGAHTGCLSVAMLAEVGAQMVIVGHSERRQDQGERDADVQRKAAAVLAGGLTAIVCVGETEAQRDAGAAVATVTGQLGGSLPEVETAALARLIVAYEPVWAIGTGRVPQPDDVADMHRAIRAALVARYGTVGAATPILYGGSVTGDNAPTLLGIDNVGGALVGGASLTAAKFMPIIAAANALAGAGTPLGA